jgi:chromate reductase, NAD(P)H dehydrogenase (quinone)
MDMNGILRILGIPGSLNMYPVNRPEVMISNAAQRFDAQGRLADEGSRTRIRQLLEALVTWTRRLRMES